MSIEQQLYSHYRIWNNIRENNKKEIKEFNGGRPPGTTNEYLKCNRCKKYKRAELMIKYYYDSGKSVRICIDCL